MKFASIDIGSNAIRLLFSNVIEKPSGEVVYKKASLIRVPVRLGEDAFSLKQITEEKKLKLLHVMEAFKHLIDVHEVIDFRACATSAMREASNGAEIIEMIKAKTGIAINIVDGKTEAEIIYANGIAETLNNKSSYLYIDVGGGSTELTLFSKNRIMASRSFNIGTIRLLHNQITNEHWEEMKDWVKEVTYSHLQVMGIGSGGNINKLVNMVKKKDHRQISYNRLLEIYHYLRSFSLQERITILELNPDRADVIVPATDIFLTVMKAANIQKILVPEMGLSDGIIHILYKEYRDRYWKSNKNGTK